MTSPKRQTDAPAARPRFTLWSLWILITAFCVLLGVPGGIVLLYLVAKPILIAAVLIGILLVMQSPLYLVYRHLKSQAEDETRWFD